jgi:N-acetylmuramoyl-L-alanine amidase
MTKKLCNIKYVCILLMVTFICAVQDGYSQNYLDKIVIDAGHGGKDPGALGSYSKEKDVVLKIALQTGKLIKQAYPDIEIIYTRDKDIFVPLKDRAEIANAAKADLFVSIHCNSHKSKQPQGSETYVMGLHKSEANLEVAKKENAAILLEEDYEQTYEGFNPNSDEGHIIFNFFKTAFCQIILI